MAKRDNWKTVLATHCRVNLLCDGEVVKLIYARVVGAERNTWIINGKDTGKGLIDVIDYLREKYDNITVKWKRQF